MTVTIWSGAAVALLYAFIDLEDCASAYRAGRPAARAGHTAAMWLAIFAVLLTAGTVLP